MADIFHLPRIGDAMTEGEIVEWFVAVGDRVELDQVICSAETGRRPGQPSPGRWL